MMDTDGRKPAAVLNLRYCPRICRERLNETTKSITDPPELQSGMLTTTSRRSVASPLLNTTLRHSRPRTRRCAVLLNAALAFTDVRILYVSRNIIISATQTVHPLQDGFPKADFPPRRSWFHPRSGHEKFVVDEVTEPGFL
jgi:hypothetical protein